MRVVVMAYQEVGCVCLEALIRAGAEVVMVLTHDDDPEETIWFRSVADLARNAGIPVHRPTDPNTPETAALIAGARPDFIFSFYYRHLIDENILSIPLRGAYNMHGSLLPEYRGRAPINWVLVHGRTETGMTLHRMVKKPDAGAIVGQKRVPIGPADTIRELYTGMVAAAGDLMAEVWPGLASGNIEAVPQDETRASYYGGRRPKDGLIHWDRPAEQLYDLVRAVTFPYPGAFTLFLGRKLHIWSADFDPQRETGRSPGRVLGLEPRGLAVAAGQGCLFIRAAAWEGEDRWVHYMSRLGLDPGAQFDKG